MRGFRLKEEEIYEGFKERAELAYHGAALIIKYADHLTNEMFPELKENNLRVWSIIVDLAAEMILELTKSIPDRH